MHQISTTIALAFGAAAAAFGSGCSRSMFDWGKAERPPVEQAPPVLVDGKPMITESERPSELEQPEDAVTLQITFEVLRVDIPVRSIRHSLKTWNHVDETQSDPRLTALLARNGLRIGIATADVWPALRVLFGANHARSLHTRYAVQSGGPLSMCLGELAGGRPVFAFRRDGRLVGRMFDGGTKFLHIDYTLDPADPVRTIMKITPEVRKFSEGKHWQNVDGNIREVPRYEGEVFSELGAVLSVAPGEFLVIGPSETAELESVIGSRFLTSEENNVTYETVICVTPRTLRMERPGR